MSINDKIGSYYDQTINHYENWWKLNRNLAVHYGIWGENVKNFQESLLYTNEVMAKIANVQNQSIILDAGCGVGGSAIYLAEKFNCKVEGVTLSHKQNKYANAALSIRDDIKNNVNISVQDYCNTNFNNNHFDLIWAIESFTSAPDKNSLAKEAYRLLKPGGRLIIADYFKSKASTNDTDHLLETWQKLWSMAPFLTINQYIDIFNAHGFKLVTNKNFTQQIYPTAKRMYWSYLLGGPFAVLYNLFNNPKEFAKNHYKSGLYQYKSLKKGLWEYRIILFEKQ